MSELATQKICRYYRRSAENLQRVAENLQVLQKICIKSASIPENVQVLQKMCIQSASIPENVQKICMALQKI